MGYDKTLVAVVHPSAMPNKQTLITGAKAHLQSKGIKAATTIDPTAGSASELAVKKFSALTGRSRLYLFAHAGTTIGGVSGADLATFLHEKCGLRAVAKIVVIGCGNAHDISAVQEFHRTLRQPYGITADVLGYTASIKVIDEGDMKLVQQLAEIGSESTPSWQLGQRVIRVADKGELSDYQRPRDIKLSKYIFGWVVGEQVFDFIY